eukprot:gnl/Hemi2/25747_TR8652_c0_g1_i1.p1 gnl/Hemi2/25747_TR8652_c0_g1~~gnl/Hemi2/25747_TR8652_c0_g1_i1.p1  ORF type:complete len:252 (+),score=122.62 gnl/Hemi2/25747_TR8652_c0_g1_i1:64-819(+)
MAIGKNKKLSKRKGGKKKIIDPFTKKDWYDVRAPSLFKVHDFGKTLVTRSGGGKIASDSLKGRVFEVSLADLNGMEDECFYRKIKLRCEDVQGKHCLTNFYGMDFTTDKLRSLVRKHQSLIECVVDVKTTDGYVMRLFCIAFTKKQQYQIRKTAYAKSSKVKAIRGKMHDIMVKESSCELKELVGKFIPELIGKEIEKACSGLYPLKDVHIRKVKMLKTPRFDSTKLMDMHGDFSTSAVGEKIDRPAEETA